MKEKLIGYGLCAFIGCTLMISSVHGLTFEQSLENFYIIRFIGICIGIILAGIGFWNLKKLCDELSNKY